MHNRTPNKISHDVQVLVARVAPGFEATYVPVEPRSDGLINECFGTVDIQVKECGGAVQHGWAIWEWPTVMVEAEFHAVWASPDGRLVDVTPRGDAAHRVLFVPDPTRVFQGRQIDNVRVPVREDPRVSEFIHLAERRFEILNRGDRAFAFGAVSIPRAEIEPVMRRMAALECDLVRSATAARNDPCPCGSGRKFKKCHGSA